MPTINDYSTFAFMLQGYQASDQALNSGDTNILYYGFVDRFGAWYIQEQTTSDAGNTLAWRYDKGSEAEGITFATAWAARESGTYQRWDSEFN